MTDREDDIWPLAGEYVLGTLEADKRADVERRKDGEPALAEAIAAWERHFAPMLDDVGKGEAPRAEVLEAIMARIGGAPKAPAAPILAPPDPSEAPAAVAARSEIARLRRRAAGWRAAAMAASIALAGLVGLLVYRPDMLPLPTERNYVAVFQDGDAAPRFLLSVDLATQRLTIRPVAAEPAPWQSYQLWIVAEEFGPKPRSLGLLDGVEAPTTRVLSEISPAVLEGALFGISLEPAGGSPTGQPTGPALHGTLIPVSASEQP